MIELKDDLKTLAMLKMEKNFVAQIDKNYPRKPYDHYTCYFLFKRLEDEVAELRDALDHGDIEWSKCECADVSNIIDYLFERLSQGNIE